MSKSRGEVDAKKMLDELLKATSSCYDCIGKTEEWSGVEVNEVKNELENASEKADMNGSKTYVLEDQSEHEISNELVLKYLGSWIYDNFIDLDSRNGDKIDTGYPLKYFDKIVKYMDKEEKEIALSLEDAGDFIQVNIRDNGKGISRSDLPYIFQRFFRADSSRNSMKGGSGIGLSIVKKIIEDSGGRIWASSKEGEETTIHFVLRKYIKSPKEA